MPSAQRLLCSCVVLVAVACATACGSSSSPARPTHAALRVTLEPEGAGGPKTTWTVSCPDATRATACTRLLDAPDAFVAPAPHTACSMIYGGPQLLAVTGTLGNRTIDYSTGRTNGCEIANYARDLALVAPFRPVT
jgi:hypothetical protein